MNSYVVCFTIRIRCKSNVKYIDSFIFINANSEREAIDLIENNTIINIAKTEPIYAHLNLKDI